jgi:tripartite-type tricarboxylate transporter receptor subunit TctC
MAPVNTPPEIISRLNGEISKVLQTTEFRDKLSSMGADVYGSTQQEFATYLAAQIEMSRRLIRESGARPE